MNKGLVQQGNEEQYSQLAAHWLECCKVGIVNNWWMLKWHKEKELNPVKSRVNHNQKEGKNKTWKLHILLRQSTDAVHVGKGSIQQSYDTKKQNGMTFRRKIRKQKN